MVRTEFLVNVTISQGKNNAFENCNQLYLVPDIFNIVYIFNVSPLRLYSQVMAT
jgi:hypothetical protein